jgi:hypothetical protein
MGTSFKPSIGNESLQEISDDNRVRLVNFGKTKKILLLKSQLSHIMAYKILTWTTSGGITHNQIYHILIDKRRHSSTIDVQLYTGAGHDTGHYSVISKPTVPNVRQSRRLRWRHLI